MPEIEAPPVELTQPEVSPSPRRIGAAGAVVGIALLGIGSFVTRWAAGPPPASTVPPEVLPRFADVPYTVGEWKGREDPLTARELGMLKLDAVLARTYEGSEHKVRLLVETQLGAFREPFHYPTVCMPANGWSILRSSTRTLQSAHPGRPPEMTWLFMIQAGQYMLVSYWLWTPEGYAKVPSSFWRRVNAVGAWDRLVNANPKGALFLAYTPVEQPNGLEPAINAQVDLANRLLPSIEAVLREAVAKAQEQEMGRR